MHAYKMLFFIIDAPNLIYFYSLFGIYAEEALQSSFQFLVLNIPQSIPYLLNIYFFLDV